MSGAMTAVASVTIGISLVRMDVPAEAVCQSQMNPMIFVKRHAFRMNVAIIQDALVVNVLLEKAAQVMADVWITVRMNAKRGSGAV